MNDAVIRSRVDAKVKARAAKVFEKLGMTLSEAIRLFLHQTVAEKAIPFAIKIPNTATSAALKELDHAQQLEKVSLAKLNEDWDACAK